MLLSSEEAEKRLSSPDNLANRFSKHSDAKTIPIRRPGRKVDVPNLTPLQTNEIAFRSRLGERQGPLAREFNTTQARVSQLERGEAKSLDEDSIRERLSQVQDKALDTLMESLGLIDREKLKKESASGLSKIAAGMAKVVEATLPKDKADTNIQVVVYTPELRKEASFKVVDV